MPFYEFTCQDCKSKSEILVRSTDWTGTRCPSCDSENLVKDFSVFAAQSSSGTSMPDMSPCSGNPSACGRCDLN